MDEINCSKEEAKINSIDDLRDVRAHDLIVEVGTDIEDLYENFLKGRRAVTSGDMHREILRIIDEPSLATVDHYIPLLAALAIVSYEFTSRQHIEFPINKMAIAVDHDSKIVRISSIQSIYISRSGSIEDNERRARGFHKDLNSSYLVRQWCLDNMLNNPAK